MRGRSTSDASTSRCVATRLVGRRPRRPDARELARFYADAARLGDRRAEPAWAAIGPADGVAYLAFQTSPGYERPVWPSADGAQQMMMHLDFQVDDLAAAVAHAVDLGAEEARAPTAGRRPGAARPGRAPVLPLRGHGVLTCPNLRASAVDFASGPSSPVSLDVAWDHGSRRRGEDVGPPIQVHAADPHTFILRQSKSVHYEAPFLYLFCGNERALLLDTGATSDPADFPLRDTVDAILRGLAGRTPAPALRARRRPLPRRTATTSPPTRSSPTARTPPSCRRTCRRCRRSSGSPRGRRRSCALDLGGRVLEVTGCPATTPPRSPSSTRGAASCSPATPSTPGGSTWTTCRPSSPAWTGWWTWPAPAG